jgi:hypothetical protein
MFEGKLVLDLVGGTHRNGLSTRMVGDLICKVFGGFTASPTYGCWWDETKGVMVDDQSITFSVAIAKLQWPEFKKLARLLADGQDSVYVVGPEGPEVLDLHVVELEEVAA